MDGLEHRSVYDIFYPAMESLRSSPRRRRSCLTPYRKRTFRGKRIRPLLTELRKKQKKKTAGAVSLKLDQAGGAYPGGKQIFDGLTISAKPGQIIGITGPVACGKSTLGKIFSGRSALYRACFVKRGKNYLNIQTENAGSMVGWQGHDLSFWRTVFETMSHSERSRSMSAGAFARLPGSGGG